MNFDYRKKENLIKIGAILLFVISLLILIGWRYANPDLSLRNPLIVMIIMTILSLIAFFSQKLFKKEKTEDDIPEPMSKEEIEEEIKNEVERKFWNHIKINNGFNCIKTRPVNKNLICAYKINLIYEEIFEEEKTNSLICVINANYKNIPISFHKHDISNSMLEKEMNLKSFNPREEPDEEERTETDLSSGTQVKYKKKTHKKEKKEEKPDVE